MANLKVLTKQCIAMLEKYYQKAQNLPNNNKKVLNLEAQDLKDWKNTYYPELVKSGLIRDGEFFQKPLKNLNYGIGIDGAFTKYEYVQFLWRAYKYIVTDFSANSGVKYIKECIDTLEPYSSLFENHSTETSDVKSFNSVDMKKWKYEYYPYFSKSGLIPDGQFFGNLKENANYGIGKDGAFSGEELCHFLYQLYKFADRVISKNIPTWKILFLLCKKTTYNGEIISLSERDISDIKNIMRRFQNFVFAFSSGNVAIEILEKDLDNPVPLRSNTSTGYYVDLRDLPQEDGLFYFIDNKIDAGICYMSLEKFSSGWLGLTRSGYISLGSNKQYFSFINVRTLENTSNEKYLEPSDACPFPEEVVVHEFCHTLQYVLQDLFKLGTLVNPDDSSKYGYSNQTPNAPIGGFYNFYQDILAGKVKDKNGSEIGVKPEMWKNTMRTYNTSQASKASHTKALSSVPSDVKPVILDIKVDVKPS